MGRSPLKTEAKHVHLICSADRAGLYAGMAKALQLELRMAAGTIDALHAVVYDPGVAILVDMTTTLHAGVSETGRLYELGIAMPILRCTQDENGAWTAMCQAPFKRLPMLAAMREIAAGDPSWKHPNLQRFSVRVPLRSRVRFRGAGGSDWIRANLLNASVGGMFILTHDVQPEGAELEIELLDVGGGMILRGRTVWGAPWDDGARLPGMGIQLDPVSLTPEYRNSLADLYTSRKPG